MWDHKNDLSMFDEVFEGNEWKRIMTTNLLTHPQTF
jgi:hypothetical protein